MKNISLPTILFFEDFPIGKSWDLGQYTFTENEIVEFAKKYDPQPFHIDSDAAKSSHFNSLIASGWHTCSVIMRMNCDTYLLNSASLGSPGVEEIRWMHPVRPNDTISAKTVIIEARRSISKPDRGLVKFLWSARNQDGIEVITIIGKLFLKTNSDHISS
jgi:acyl dehydratase